MSLHRPSGWWLGALATFAAAITNWHVPSPHPLSMPKGLASAEDACHRRASAAVPQNETRLEPARSIVCGVADGDPEQSNGDVVIANEVSCWRFATSARTSGCIIPELWLAPKALRSHLLLFAHLDLASPSGLQWRGHVRECPAAGLTCRYTRLGARARKVSTRAATEEYSVGYRTCLCKTLKPRRDKCYCQGLVARLPSPREK